MSRLPQISITSPRESIEKAIFFPSRGNVAREKTDPLPSGDNSSDNKILKDKNSEAVNKNITPSVLFRVKPNPRQVEPGHLITDQYVPNKENVLVYRYQQRHKKSVIITREGLASASKAREREHVSAVSGNMSRSKTQPKKVTVTTGSLRARDQSFSTTSSGNQQFRGVISGHCKSRVQDSGLPKYTPKDTDRLSRNSVSVKGISKSKESAKKEEKLKPQVSHALLHPKHSGGHEERTRRVSPGSPLKQMTDESPSKGGRRYLNISPKPKDSGIERKLKTPKKVTPIPSPAARHGKNDDSAEGSLEDLVPVMELPKVTMNEVLQSWNIGLARNRTSSLAGKDPMEFLLSRERSDSEPKQRTTSLEELRRCRYLRTGGKNEQELKHSKICSCNSCEHGQGLKSTPYLNS